MNRLLKGFLAASMMFGGLNALAQDKISEDKIRRLIEEMKSDNTELSQVATMELAGLGEEGLSAFENIMRLPGDHETEWEAYKEILGKVRKSTRITIRQEKGKTSDVLKEIAKQADIQFAQSAAINQLAQQEINLDAQGMLFWDLMESICRPAKLGVSYLATGDLNLSVQNISPMGSKLSGDWISLLSVDRNQKYDYQNASRGQVAVSLKFRLFPDPKRMGVYSSGECRIDRAIDDQGNVYEQSLDANSTPMMNAVARMGAVSARGPLTKRFEVLPVHMNNAYAASLTTRNFGGKKLSLRGTAVVYGSEVEVKKIDVAKIESQTLDFGGCKLIMEVVSDGPDLSIKLTARKEDWNMNNSDSFQFNVNIMLQNCVWIEDETGVRKKMSNAMMSTNGSQSTLTLKMPTQAGAAAKPFGKPTMLIISCPKDLKPISIPFEFNDIPLP